MGHEIRLAHATTAELQRDHHENLRKGRAFVVDASTPLLATGGTGPREREACQLVVVHPDSGEALVLDGEVVWVKAEPPGMGVGVELVGFGDEARAELARFVDGRAADEPRPSDRPPDSKTDEGAVRARNLFERIRALCIGDRGNVARMGSLPERVALERTFGASVWEPLLQNPQLTPPEVARIAKNGTIPKPLVQVIVSNAAWLAVPEVHRALLGNPRVAGPHLERVIRAVPRADLARMATSNAYRSEVRTLAARAAKTK